ncbi:MAG: insulinase family protein ['Candidatus Kapabacteria' thiocyanatum]|uniref:Peptidase M16 n=1 Tax=Candidatus Kapaibacterium thiocyanatum TaxID=1895771 RepID=A0A1M3L336_9BACT|nr:insulinase family protein ['Candidatus Kapabacteria' thiocyanatum]OJX59701.1 MAG: hypothetical protein BGO89_05650 ['Candidatus Kapabacteria' thiocyanatum]
MVKAMFRILSAIVVLFSLSASGLRAQHGFSSVPGDPAATKIHTLANGLRVYVSVNDDQPRATVYVVARTGSKQDPADATGLAHYLEHMLFKGNEEFGTLDFAKERPLIDRIESTYERYRQTTDTAMRRSLYRTIDSLSGIAATFAIPNEYDRMCQALGCTGTNAFTSEEVTAYYNEVPSNRLKTYFEMEGARFRKPVLRLFHTELEAVYEEKNGSLDDDRSLIEDTLRAALFPTHPYGTQSTLGTIQHLKNPSMKRIREYYDTYYVPNNMAVIVAGDVDPDSVAAWVEASFGWMRRKNVPEWKPAALAEIAAPVENTVQGREGESVTIGFRWPGANHADIPALQMLDMVLSNGVAGLIDLNLRHAQKVADAASVQYMMSDHGYHILGGNPFPGQSLVQVRNLLLDQLRLVKQGAFDEAILDGIIRKYRIDRTRQLSTAQGRADWILESLMLGRSYPVHARSLDALSMVTKDDIVRVANKYYGENHVIVYKQVGPRMDLRSIVKPDITPVALNRDTLSPFAFRIMAQQAVPVAPRFVDLAKDVRTSGIGRGVVLRTTHNRDNDLFSLTYRIPVGALNDPLQDYALDYLSYLGTSERNGGDVQREKFRLGMSMDHSTDDDYALITVSGLQESFVQSLDLAEHLIADARSDTAQYSAFVLTVLKTREDQLKDKTVLLQEGLVPYAKYGPDNPTMRDPSNERLRTVGADTLLAIIRSLFAYDHEIWYYGPVSHDSIATIIGRHHRIPATHKAAPVVRYPVVRTLDKPEVWIIDHDMVQAEVTILSKALPRFDPTHQAVVRAFNEYMGGGMNGLVFQTLRESQALAYGAGISIPWPENRMEPMTMEGYIGTQVDKLNDALASMNTLMTSLPKNDPTFVNVKESLLSQYRTSRIERAGILSFADLSRRYGLGNDWQQRTYDAIGKITYGELHRFFDDNIARKPRVIAIIGSKERLDLPALERYGKVRVVTVKDLFPW